MFPFHTWLPDAHVEAPTAGSVILAGVLLKMGTYGFIRLAIPLFPEAAIQFSPIFIFLSLVVLGGFLCSEAKQKEGEALWVSFFEKTHFFSEIFGNSLVFVKTHLKSEYAA